MNKVKQLTEKNSQHRLAEGVNEKQLIADFFFYTILPSMLLAQADWSVHQVGKSSAKQP